MKIFLLILLNIACLTPLFGCGGSSAVGGTETGTTDTGAIAASAVGAAFGSSDQNASNSVPRVLKAKLLAMLIREAQASQNTLTACEAIEQDHEADGVTSSAGIEAGTYGVPGNEITVTESDGCDQGGEYVSFVVNQHSLNCSGGSLDGELVVTMEEGQGVWTENIAENISEIYGTFTMVSESEEAIEVSCSLTISHGGVESDSGPISGDCIDGEGQAIEQTTDVVCQDA